MNRMIRVFSKMEDQPIISKYIYGHFAEHLGRCIYDGIYVGENSDIPNKNGMRIDVVEALKHIHIPVLRWPGGCFADEYHWKDGVGDKTERRKIVNTHWGGVSETNHFGTHEFFELISQLECDAYINGNVGSGTVQEMQEWVEYMTSSGESPMTDWRKKNGREKPWKVAFFGVGNESWGCGGNMRPQYYADLYRQYQTYVRQYGKQKLYKIACGPNVDDYVWMEEVLKHAAAYMDGISLHHYSLTDVWEKKGSATNFTETEWFSLIKSAYRMDELITRHSTIMDKYDPDRRIGLIVDEWGSWLAVEPGTNPGFLYQQNTIRDAMVAAITLNIFHKHAQRVHMANLAQTVNVLQAVLLTEGPNMVKTPTYHVFDLYKCHQDARRVSTYDGDEKLQHIDYTVSKKENILSISVCNYNLEGTQELMFEIEDTVSCVVEARHIVGEKMDAHNDFHGMTEVEIRPLQDVKVETHKLTISVPAKSVSTIRVELV